MKSLERIRVHERTLRVQAAGALPRRKAVLESHLSDVRERITELERLIARQANGAKGR